MRQAKPTRRRIQAALAVAWLLAVHELTAAPPGEPAGGELAAACDANRDGRLTDADAAAARAGRAAVVMANRDDDDRDGRPDADDERVNGTADAADLVPLQITVPSSARTLKISCGAAPLRFFREAAAGWQHLGLREAEIEWEAGNGTRPDAVTLHVESCAWAGMPASWNGQAAVEIQALDGAGRTIAAAAARYDVAPVLLAPSTAPATEVFVAAGRYDNAGFVSALERRLGGLAVPLKVYQTDDWREMWMQDTMEVATAATPQARMHVVLAGLRGADRFPPTLLGPDTAVATVGMPRHVGGGDAWADWYGNLEVSPPTADHAGGRVIHGRNVMTGESFHPEVVAFLAAQGMQDPVWIDTSWLLIKHVDEIVAFLPGKDGRGVLVVPDPEEGLRLLGEQAVAEPHAGRRREANSRIAGVIEAMLAGTTQPPRAGAVGGPGVAGLLDLLGIDAGSVVRLPVAFDVPPEGLLDDGGVTNASSAWSNPVNALVINGAVVCGSAGMPAGVREICRERFLAAGADSVEFIDDGVYQKNHGNVHCATNARRWMAEADPP